jgi:uncharacterized repeat protein (TIGR03843 family)
METLREGGIEVLGLLPYASNATFLVEVKGAGSDCLGVYKPRRGERPLWDFPDGTLCAREYAAYVADRALGWELVPPTVLREGPAGFGALQLFVEPDGEADVRALPETHPDELRRMALLDVVINNADRKAGHLVVDEGGKLWGVDHGICFAAEPKLRTVIWVYEGEEVPACLLEDLEALAGCWDRELSELLSPEEVSALERRARMVLETRRFPAAPAGHRHVPWPPW